MFDTREKIAVFIDGYQLYTTSRALGFDIDFSKLRHYLSTNGYLLRVNYYTTMSDDGEYSSVRPLVDWLGYNGYKVITKLTKEWTDAEGRRKFKGNIHLELAMDAVSLVDVADHFVFFTGDGDYRVVVEALQRKGRKVTIVSTTATRPPMVADELRRQADHFLDLASLKDEVGRPSRQQDQDLDEGLHRILGSKDSD